MPILGPSLLFCGKPACWIRSSNPEDKVSLPSPSPTCWMSLPQVQSQGDCGSHKELAVSCLHFFKKSGHAFSMSANGNSNANLSQNKITRVKRVSQATQFVPSPNPCKKQIFSNRCGFKQVLKYSSGAKEQKLSSDIKSALSLITVAGTSEIATIEVTPICLRAARP